MRIWATRLSTAGSRWPSHRLADVRLRCRLLAVASDSAGARRVLTARSGFRRQEERHSEHAGRAPREGPKPASQSVKKSSLSAASRLPPVQPQRPTGQAIRRAIAAADAPDGASAVPSQQARGEGMRSGLAAGAVGESLASSGRAVGVRLRTLTTRNRGRFQNWRRRKMARNSLAQHP